MKKNIREAKSESAAIREFFKAEYAKINVQVKQIKQKLREVKKLAKPAAKASVQLFTISENAMYHETKGKGITPKFAELSKFMFNLEVWMDLDRDIQTLIENIP